MAARTLLAPFSISISAAMQIVPAVSIISSTMITLRPFHVADGRHFTHDIGFRTLLVRDDDRGAQVLGIGVGPFGAAHVGCRDREVLDVQAFDVRYEDAAGIECIHRYVEEALDLVRMQVHGHNAVHACRDEHVGYQFRADRYAGTVFAVLTRPAEVGHHGDHLVGRCAACGIDHHKEFHQVVQRREGRLDDEHGAAADRLVEAGLELSVAELLHLRVSERGAVACDDFLREVPRAPACEEFDFVDSHSM